MDTMTPRGDHIANIRRALLEARRQTLEGQRAPNGRHVEDALVEADERIGNILGLIETAIDRDMADAEDSGDAERERRAWRSFYRAA
jgi:hypothetical protein